MSTVISEAQLRDLHRELTDREQQLEQAHARIAELENQNAELRLELDRRLASAA